MTSYCMAPDVRRLTGKIDTSILSDEDIDEFIKSADAKIDSKITFSSPIPQLIKDLSSLLAAIKVYSRPDLRVGFKIGELTVSTDNIEKCLIRWKTEVDDIFSQFPTVDPYQSAGKGVVKSSSYSIIDEDSRYA